MSGVDGFSRTVAFQLLKVLLSVLSILLVGGGGGGVGRGRRLFEAWFSLTFLPIGWALNPINTVFHV